MILNISEIFRSIQGEGPEAGQEMIFVRFSGCNLRCLWGGDYCDTPYTSWDPEKNHMSLEEVVRSVENIGEGCRSIVITGGEPTIHPGLSQLCRELSARGYTLSLETNGRAAIPSEISVAVCSPKLSDSVPVGTKFEALHERERVILNESICSDDPRVFLKFVVSDRTSIDEIQTIVQERGFTPERVYLMPLGTSAALLDLNMPAVRTLSERFNYKISDRLHIRQWGNLRGR